MVRCTHVMEASTYQHQITSPYHYSTNMHKLVVLRHGESQWNHENKFCGWIDIPLSEKGEKEAQHAGELLKKYDIRPDVMFTSMLQRLIKTGNIILETIGRMWIPQYKLWRLNERHYGLFQGRDKNEVFKEFGKEKYQFYRRNVDGVPPETGSVDNDESIDERYKFSDIPVEKLPQGELLRMTIRRVVPHVDDIVKNETLKQEREVLIVTHGSIVRSLIKHFCKMSDEAISKINAPTGVPLVFELDEQGNLLKEMYYLDEELAKKGIAKVAMEGHGSQSKL